MIEVLMALALLGLGAMGSIGLARLPRASLGVSLGSIGVAGLICCVASLRALLPGSFARVMSAAWPLPIGALTLAVDGLTAWFLLVIGLVSAAVAIYSWGYFQDALGRESIWAVGSLLNVLVAAMVITVCASNVVLFLIGWELMSLSAFLLVGFHHRDSQTRHGAWMYLIATHLGTAFGVLPMFGVLVARADSTSFVSFAGVFDHARTGTCVLLLFLGLLGFGTKAGLMPMHVWLPEAHPVAPSPVSALMSGVVIKTGIYGILRLLTWLPQMPRSCAFVVLCMAMVTGVLGILYALAQRHYKRMLAYSSVENIGIIALGIGLGMLGRSTHQPILTLLGFGGALLHVLNHALFKGLLFLSAGAVLHATGVGDGERLGGIARRDPLNAALFAVGCAAICALPPLNGFVGEFLIYSGLLRSAAVNSLMVAALSMAGIAALALIGGLALSGFSKLFGVVFLGEPRDATVRMHATPASMIAGMTLLAAGCAGVSLGAPLIGKALLAPMALINNQPINDELYLDAMLSPLGWISGASILALVVIGALVVLRQRFRRPELAVAPQPTWGCGYSSPSPQMQYSGSSYVWKLAHSFRALLRPERVVTRPEGYFARRSGLSTQTTDAAVRRGYRPVFAAVARVCERLWPLQHGRIQLYLVYIVATLLLVVAAEAWLSPFSGDKPQGNPEASVNMPPPGDGPAANRQGGHRFP